MADSDRRSRAQVTGVVLAAGQSKRFGQDHPKQLYEVEGEALVRRIARVALASNLSHVIVVTGHCADQVAAALVGLEVEVVENLDFAKGQSTSVKTGLSHVAPHAEAALFVPCDLLNLEFETLNRLLDAYRATGGPIVVPTVDGNRFAPVLFDRTLFDEIKGTTGDRGARQLFPRHEAEIVEVEFGSTNPFQDLDRLV